MIGTNQVLNSDWFNPEDIKIETLHITLTKSVLVDCVRTSLKI